MVALNRRYFADFDWSLLGFALLLGAFGAVEISSAQAAQSLPGLWQKHLIGLGVGVVIMFVTTLIDYRKIVSAAPIFYGVGLVLLILVLLIGKKINGNKSWLPLGGLTIQPSELAKLFTIL